MGSSAGGVFLPNDPPPSTNQTLTTPTISAPTLSGTVTGTYTLGGTPTVTSPTISGATITGGSVTTTGAVLTAPVVSGAATVASGATLTTPTVLFTSSDVIATGSTGSNAAAISAVMPTLVNCNGTGASGAGINLPTGAAGNVSFIFNNMTGVLKIYAIASTINGTTGTTAFTLTATGNKMAVAMCNTAGAWLIAGNT